MASRAEVETWSVARIRIWTLLIDEHEYRKDLSLSAAVWKPEAARDAIHAIQGDIAQILGKPSPHGGGNAWSPTSRESIVERIRRAGQPLIE